MNDDKQGRDKTRSWRGKGGGKGRKYFESVRNCMKMMYCLKSSVGSLFEE